MLALPIFPASHPASIVGADELNFCVRDGNRWTLIAINTNYSAAEGQSTFNAPYSSTSPFNCQEFLFLENLRSQSRTEAFLAFVCLIAAYHEDGDQSTGGVQIPLSEVSEPLLGGTGVVRTAFAET